MRTVGALHLCSLISTSTTADHGGIIDIVGLLSEFYAYR